MRSGKFSYNDHELEYETAKLMKAAPEKYRKAVAKQEANDATAALLAETFVPPMGESAAAYSQ